LTFEWDALRAGDRVLVHDDDDIGGPLLHGVVAMVDSGKGRGGSDVGVRATETDGTVRMRRPLRLATHLDPHDPAESCWRCTAVSAHA
jgi:hypothetical protein